MPWNLHSFECCCSLSIPRSHCFRQGLHASKARRRHAPTISHETLSPFRIRRIGQRHRNATGALVARTPAAVTCAQAWSWNSIQCWQSGQRAAKVLPRAGRRSTLQLPVRTANIVDRATARHAHAAPHNHGASLVTLHTPKPALLSVIAMISHSLARCRCVVSPLVRARAVTRSARSVQCMQRVTHTSRQLTTSAHRQSTAFPRRAVDLLR